MGNADLKRAVPIGSNKQVFANTYLIDYGEVKWNSDSMEFRYWPQGIRIQHGNPHIDPTPLLVGEYPWENGLIGCYTSVFWDETFGRFRLFYEAFEKGKFGTGKLNLCYAESKDGLKWNKPNLNLVKWHDSEGKAYPNNNLILTPDMCPYHSGIHGNCIFKDTNPKCSPEERYKTAYKCGLPGINGEVHVMTSSDGFHWKFSERSVCDSYADTQTVIFFDTSLNKYRGYFRDWHGNKRSVLYSETTDFFNWPTPRVLWSADPNLDLGIDYYSSGTHPWPRTENTRIAICTMFDRVKDKCYIDLLTQYNEGPWVRIGNSPLITNGPPDSESAGMVFGGHGIYQPPSEPFHWSFPLFIAPYGHGKSDANGADSRGIWRAKIPVDGFVGIIADTEGDFWTPFLKYEGNCLKVTGNTMDSFGEIRVEVQEVLTEEILPGLALKNCSPLRGAFIEQRVIWDEDPDLEEYSDCVVRLHFHMKCAELNSFQFVNEAKKKSPN